MFILYRLFRRFTPSSSTPLQSPVPSSVPDPAKDRALHLWFAVFGISLLFRPAIELVFRILCFAVCALLIGVVDGSLTLLVGHAVLRAAKYDGYEPSLLSSMAAGSLGGIVVIWPITLTTVCLVALVGGLKLVRALSIHVTFLLELLSATATCAAACALGVTILLRTRPENGTPLDATHAARAGALGACILTVPIVSTAVFLMREAQPMPSARNELMVSPTDNFEYSVNHVAPSPRIRRHRHVIAHTAAETVGYMLVTLCVLTIRLLCF